MRVSDKELQRILQQDGYEATDGYYDDGNGRAIVTPEPPKQHRGKRTEIDGIKFDSQHEAHRYVTLKELEKMGLITQLECHPSFVVYEGFTRNGTEYGRITYEADFAYMQDGYLIVEDVKATTWNKKRTGQLFRIERDSKLRMKMFVKQYVDDKTVFKVVDKHGNTHPLKWK